MAPNRDSASPHQMNCVSSFGLRRHFILQVSGRTRTENSWELGDKEYLEGYKTNREPGGSHTRFRWLRDRLENSNYILLRIPIEIHLFQRGLQGICMDPDPLPEELGLTKQDIERLVQAGLVRRRPQKPRPKERIDYVALQQTYRQMLAEGPFATQTELARHLGVSRVWVSRVLKGISRGDR